VSEVDHFLVLFYGIVPWSQKSKFNQRLASEGLTCGPFTTRRINEQQVKLLCEGMCSLLIYGSNGGYPAGADL
jgi:hypothetical protein